MIIVRPLQNFLSMMSSRNAGGSRAEEIISPLEGQPLVTDRQPVPNPDLNLAAGGESDAASTPTVTIAGASAEAVATPNSKSKESLEVQFIRVFVVVFEYLRLSLTFSS